MELFGIIMIKTVVFCTQLAVLGKTAPRQASALDHVSYSLGNAPGEMEARLSEDVSYPSGAASYCFLQRYG